MKKKWILFSILVAAIVILVYGGFAIRLAGSKPASSLAQGKIALIKIDGMISDSDLSGPFNVIGTEPEPTIELIRRADSDLEIKAILLRINSPGGTVAASQEIYRELMRVSKPVISSIGDVGASGAYYVACASSRIVASPSSAVGSIGVIMEAPNYGELLKKLGVEMTVVTSGKHKDIGNPARKMTPEEMLILQSQSDLAYKQFTKDVAKGRRVKISKAEEWATGLAYPGEEAKKMGLIDDLGNYQDAIDLAAELGKIVGEPEIVEYSQPTVVDLFKRALQGRQLGAPRGVIADFFQILLRENQFQVK